MKEKVIKEREMKKIFFSKIDIFTHPRSLFYTTIEHVFLLLEKNHFRGSKYLRLMFLYQL
jgi:hypothetical protein